MKKIKADRFGLACSSDKVKNLNDEQKQEITHRVSTRGGYSGAPIILSIDK